MNLFLVRHGIMGTTSTNDFLTELGERQARATGRYFASTSIAALVSSPLVRALGTAQLMAEEMGDLSFEVWPELREGLYDEVETYGKKELADRYPLAQFPDSMDNDMCIYPGDTQESMIQRARQVLERIEASFGPEDTIILVAHGGIISYLFHVLLHVSHDEFSFFSVRHCSISHVHLIPPEKREAFLPLYPASAVDVISVGETGHLVGCV